MATDPDTGVVEGDQIARVPPGADQNDFTSSNSGNSGNDREIGAPGTAGSVPQAERGAPQPYQ